MISAHIDRLFGVSTYNEIAQMDLGPMKDAQAIFLATLVIQNSRFDKAALIAQQILEPVKDEQAIFLATLAVQKSLLEKAILFAQLVDDGNKKQETLTRIGQIWAVRQEGGTTTNSSRSKPSCSLL